MTSSSSDRTVAVLKSWPFDRGPDLPYRMDYLRAEGLQLRWTDSAPSGRLVRRVEGIAVPFSQTLSMASTITSSDAVLAMFESEGNFLAAYRRLMPGGRKRPVFAVLTCWLAHVLSTSGPRRRAGYRWAYEAVDRIYYLSRNQGPVLSDLLGADRGRLRYLPFGVDTDTFYPLGEPDGDYVLAVGRDRGRDWPLLLRAVEDIGLPVKLCCRPADLAGLRIPEGVDVLGFVDRSRYRDLLGRARVVVIASRPLLYPSGQSVLLEAMAMSRCVVVTETSALTDYLSDGVTALAVPPEDPAAFRERLIQAIGDEDLRTRIGRGGRAAVEDRFNARTMWADVATDLRSLIDRGPA